MIRFEGFHALAPIAATSRYVPSDHALLVEPKPAPSGPLHRVSIDTLTLQLHPTNEVLVGMDAYTNAERWTTEELLLPRVSAACAIRCLEPVDEHGIGRGSLAPVRYTYSPKMSLLRLQMTDDDVASWIRCLTCGICGLTSDGDLVEFWIEGVTLRASTAG
jgi:hypothetical protein